MFKRILGKLLHVCNSEPWCFGTKDDFYALKQRLLAKYGTPDGYDVQHIPGKPCWSCEGTGGLYERGGCYKCCGSGWFKHPVWIVLARYRLGRYTFHTPQERSYEKPKPDTTSIEGYVVHANYRHATVQWSALLLSLAFDRPTFRKLLRERMRNTRLWRISRKRCLDCGRHTWSLRWRCRACQKRWEARDKEAVPF